MIMKQKRPFIDVIQEICFFIVYKTIRFILFLLCLSFYFLLALSLYKKDHDVIDNPVLSRSDPSYHVLSPYL